MAICLIVAALALGMAVKGHSLAPNRTRTSGIRLTVGTSLITIATTALCWGRTLHWGVVAGTAISLRCLRLAVRRFFANQGTFGLLTVRRAVALPVAKRLLADGLARRRWVGALGMAGRLLADSVTFRASAFLTVLDRAADLAFRFVAFDLTL